MIVIEKIKDNPYNRNKLPVDEKIKGPAIVLQKDTTTIIRPGDIFKVDNQGNMIISIKNNYGEIDLTHHFPLLV